MSGIYQNPLSCHIAVMYETSVKGVALSCHIAVMYETSVKGVASNIMFPERFPQADEIIHQSSMDTESLTALARSVQSTFCSPQL